MELTNKQLHELWSEEAILDENDNTLYEVVEEGEWTDGGKYQDKEVIFKDVITGKHYSFNITRSGSYFSHYEYEIWDKPVEVVQEVKMIIVNEWVEVKNG